MPIVGSVVVLYLSLTAETFLSTMRLSNDDLPAFGAPRKHVVSDLAPSGESLQNILIGMSASSGI